MEEKKARCSGRGRKRPPSAIQAAGEHLCSDVGGVCLSGKMVAFLIARKKRKGRC